MQKDLVEESCSHHGAQEAEEKGGAEQRDVPFPNGAWGRTSSQESPPNNKAAIAPP